MASDSVKVCTSAPDWRRSCKAGRASAGPIRTMLDDTERRVYHGYNCVVPPDSVALHCAGLVKRYGAVTAVNGLDLQVVRGECFGLLGPNGAGKTTTIEILEGLLAADAGEVEILGRRWSDGAARLREHL